MFAEKTKKTYCLKDLYYFDFVLDLVMYHLFITSGDSGTVSQHRTTSGVASRTFWEPLRRTVSRAFGSTRAHDADLRKHVSRATPRRRSLPVRR